MSSEQQWKIQVANLETRIAVGIHDFEKTPQRVLVNAVIEGNFPAKPQAIEDCFNYEHVHRFVVKEWPGSPHTPLLETRVAQLLEHIFRTDPRVTAATVSVAKPDIFKEAGSVGVEAQWTRADFTRHCGK